MDSKLAVLLVAAVFVLPGILAESDAEEGKEVTVFLNYQGGTGPETTMTLHSGDILLEKLPVPTKEKTDFIGWAFDSDGKTLVSESDVCGTESIIFYAIWNESFYMIFNTNGSETEEIVSEEYHYGDKTKRLPSVSRTGYEFKGWALDQSGKEMIYEGFVLKKQSDFTVYAIWEKIPEGEKQFPLYVSVPSMLASIAVSVLIMRKGIV